MNLLKIDPLTAVANPSYKPLYVTPTFGEDPFNQISSSDPSLSNGCELDLHADSAVVGMHCHILRNTGTRTSVRGFYRFL